jgi:hypothetical protein
LGSPLLRWVNRHALTQKIGLAFAASLLLVGIGLAGLLFVPRRPA